MTPHQVKNGQLLFSSGTSQWSYITTGLQGTAQSQAIESIEGLAWANPAETKGAGAVCGTAVSGREEIPPSSACSQRLAEVSIRIPCNPSLAADFQSGNTGDKKMDIPKRFPKLFKGLGNLGDPYRIQLKEDA